MKPAPMAPWQLVLLRDRTLRLVAAATRGGSGTLEVCR